MIFKKFETGSSKPKTFYKTSYKDYSVLHGIKLRVSARVVVMERARERRKLIDQGQSLFSSHKYFWTTFRLGF